MNRAISIVVLLLLNVACPASGDNTATTRPVPQDSRVQALFKELHPGMSHREAIDLVKHALGGSWGKIVYGHKTGISRCALDDGSSVILEFSVDGGDERLTSFSLVTFEDLKPRFPNDLYDAVRLIHLSPSVDGAKFDPPALIRAVNGLHPLGKEKALAACRAYIDVARDVPTQGKYGLDEQRVFLILRLLFVNSNGDPEMPWLYVGATSPDVRPGNKDWPLFPLVLVNETPFCLCGGYSLAGEAQSPLAHVDYCEKNCVLRKKPLSPAESPLKSVDLITHSERWSRLFSDKKEPSQTEHRLRMQGLRAVAAVLSKAPKESALNPDLVPQEQADKTWATLKMDRRLRNITWETDRFVGK